MSITWDPRNKRWRFAFKRVIEGRRQRTSRLLPAGWSQAQADAFDRKESARLYAVASGVAQTDPLIDEAVKLYGEDKLHLKSYKQTIEHLAAIAWAYAGKHVSQLADIAREVVKVESARGMAPATIRNRLACLKAACRHAWKAHGLTAADPTARMQLPEVRNARQVYAMRSEMLRIARAADRHDVRIMVRVAFYTGMRLGEILRVEVRDSMLLLADTKNGDLRAIPAHPKIRTCLDYLPLATYKRTLQAGFMRARAAVGLEYVHIHDLRHSAASEMVNAGVPLHTVGAVLGHRDARSTQRYSHHRQDILAEAVGKIGRKKQAA